MKTGSSDTGGDFDQYNSGGFEIAKGDTATRDGLSPELGMLRYNTDVSRPEIYTNTGWKRLLIDADLGSSNIESAINAKLRAAKRMSEMTLLFQRGGGAGGAPTYSSMSGSQPSWLTKTDTKQQATFKGQDSSRGNNYYVFQVTDTSTPEKSLYYKGYFNIDVYKMLNLTGSRWDYVYTGFGGVNTLSGQLYSYWYIKTQVSTVGTWATAPDMTDNKDTDPNYGIFRTDLNYSAANRENHTQAFAYYFSARRFKNF